MKKTISFIFIVFVLFSCSQRTGLESVITKAANSKFELTINNAGVAIYRLTQSNEEGFISAEKIKNAIDKYLNAVPTKQELKTVSYTGNLCDRYDWETPKIKVHLYIEYADKNIQFEVDVTEK